MQKLIERIEELKARDLVAAGLIGASAVITPVVPINAAEPQHQAELAKDKDPDIVAKVIAGEAASEGEEGMKGVACVIQRRSGVKGKGPTYYDPINIVLAKGQFDAVKHPEMMERNYAEVKDIADALASKIGSLVDNTDGATHFVTSEYHEKNKDHGWLKNMEVTKTIGKLVFMKEKK